ncbi:hypothetical protein Psta_0663 [Pirellula staleyi DSM 6068]|uniref:Uncharacterized protein n=1 Tax=Pirellula staleyi (strain ATCC 27377 / DSM 6068 / ICPB 4128) TaxID=530564 RepID=D2R590_PIRSD|nr:hypothetical protein Psta_0663 [Pirellula staleyi DSM 6068]
MAEKRAMNLRSLQDSTEEFASKATALSNRLMEVEQFLQQLPSKMPVEVSLGDNVLSFKRWGGSWRLTFGVHHEECGVIDAPIGIKSTAAQLLPELINELMTNITGHLVEVDLGLEALDSIPSLSSKVVDLEDI